MSVLYHFAKNKNGETIELTTSKKDKKDITVFIVVKK